MKKRMNRLTAKWIAVSLTACLIFSPCTAVYADEASAFEEDAVMRSGSEQFTKEAFDPFEDGTAAGEIPFEEPETGESAEEGSENDLFLLEEETEVFDNADIPEAEEEDIELLSDPEEEPFEMAKAGAGVTKGTAVTGTFDAVSGMDISTIRYCWKEPADGETAEKECYGFASFSKNDTGGYNYSFEAPCDDFAAVEASETVHGNENIAGATVIAAYYDLNTWDGAVDVSWYDETAAEYHIYTPAEFAGLAAIVNGSIDADIHEYNVKGLRTDLTVTEENRGLPDCIECEFQESAALGGPVTGPCYAGIEKHDFLNKTIYLEADLYMGGGDGALLDSEGIYEAKVNLHDGKHAGYEYYPNWTPIGGLFLADVDDLNSAVQAAFNGVLEGNGHFIRDLYCYRWSYPKPGTTAYGYADSTGIVGRLGYLYSEEEGNQEITAPAIRNLGLTGFVYGRRSVGGILGRAGSGTYYNGPIYLENLVNHATVYATDSKGVGGIVGTFWNKDVVSGQILEHRRGGSIINCYNRGNIRQMEYSGPAGGIVGENDSADIYCCYSTGEISSVSKMGRGIGANDAGTNYTVADCFYLEGHYDCNVSDYYGYYYQNADSSLSVTTTQMNETKMRDGTLLAALNTHGTAYYGGFDGYPVLAWEAGALPGTFSYASPEGGSVSGSLPEGIYPAGTIVYLSAETTDDWTFRYFTLNDAGITGRYVTVSGDTVVSAFNQKAGRGMIEIPNNPICNIRVYLVTGNDETGYEYSELKTGDEIVEGNELTIDAEIKEGLVPDDPDYEYSASAGLEQAFRYRITYTGASPIDTYVKSFTVSDAINGENAVARIEVTPLTTEKRWKNFCDTSWFSEDLTEYTITSAKELAGVDRLIEDQVTDFRGVTLTLGNDLSLANADGSNGTRYWDGIGSAATGFAGTFDGAGHKITDITGCQYGLFARLEGKGKTDRACVRDLSVYGIMEGYNASGIAGRTAYADIENCSNFCVIDGSLVSGSSFCGGIVGYETVNCTISGCVNYAPVSGTYRVGGILGESTGNSTTVGSMKNCINYGNISAVAEQASLTYAGGIAGVYRGPVTECANYGSILSKANYTGGLVGYMTQSGNTITARITDSYNVGAVCTNAAQDSCGAGGLFGNASRFVLNRCFNYGTVTKADDCPALIGSFAGRYTTNDNNKTADVYLLDTSCDIVLSGMIKDPETGESALRSLTYEEVAALGKSDVAGISLADAAGFADADGVLAAINAGNIFILTNETHPELIETETVHVHAGGAASCSEQAVCESCGLHYGVLDPDRHIDTERRNVVTAEWMQDGYSGDLYCRGCGSLLAEGETIPVDTSLHALTVSVTENGTTLASKDYSVSEFDALKSTETVGYQYGKTGVTTTCMASDRYVTLEALLADMGYGMDDLVTASVVASSSFEDCSRETLLTRNLYVDENGNTKTVPAAIGIYYNRQNGFAEEVVKDSKLGSLTFMTGLSQSDIEADSVGGFRLIMPVTSVSFEIAAGRTNIKNAVISGVEDKVYNGKAQQQEPVVTLTNNGETVTLEAEKDYTTLYTANTNAGTAELRIIGIGDYTGTAAETFAIVPQGVTPEIILDRDCFVYSGSEQRPAVAVKIAEDELSPDDYSVIWPKESVDAGTYAVTVKLNGNYTGTKDAAYTIEPAEQFITLSSSAASIAVGKTAVLTVTGAAGSVSYASSNTGIATVSGAGKVTAKKAGTAKITVTAAADNYREATATVTIKVVPAATASLSASSTASGVKLTWKKVAGASGYYIERNGKQLKKITKGSTVTYTDKKAAKNGTKYVYKIYAYASTGKSTLSRSVTAYFITHPALSSAKSTAAKKVSVKWKKNSKAGGYEIQYSTKNAFPAKSTKSVTAAGASKTSKVITGLTSGKKWYVRVRAYKKVGSTVYYSAWSAKKAVKVK